MSQANTSFARMQQLHKTEAQWKELTNALSRDDIEFIPKSGEIVVYDRDDTVPYIRFKVGDGDNSLDELPFFIPMPATIDGGLVTYTPPVPPETPQEPEPELPEEPEE